MGSRAGQWVDAARRAIDALNETYGGGFYLFFREPVFQKTDERYQGWERKRGALLELCRLLKGRRTGLQVLSGERGALNGTRFVLTLDSDTALNVGSARELTGAMLHPLNRAVVDRRRRVVVSGYGVLQPRVGVELGAANKSQFARIFAGQGGVDPMAPPPSDVYHDLFEPRAPIPEKAYSMWMPFYLPGRPFPGKPGPLPRSAGGLLSPRGTDRGCGTHRQLSL